ncbi:hypothetical protein MMC29_000712 [Sticta canariensis]|nr:hypothetical protein [Sticta canariensis]
MSVASAGIEQQDTAMHKLLQMMTGAGVGGWVPHLSQTFEQQGLLDAQTYRYPITPQSRLYWTQMQFNSNEEYSIVAMNNSTPDATGPKCRRLIEEAVRESREGVAFDYIPEVTIGRKPL